MAHQRTQSLGEGLHKAPHTVSLKVLRLVGVRVVQFRVSWSRALLAAMATTAQMHLHYRYFFKRGTIPPERE